MGIAMRFKKKFYTKGFSLVEVMIAATIFLVAIAGILISYITCLELSHLSRNTSTALHAAKNRLEDIKNTSFAQIKTTYDGVTFVTSGLNGLGISYVDDSNPRLLKITVSFCWRQPSGRVIGEDTDLNGQLAASEDKNNNGLIDSPVELVYNIFQ